MIIGIGTDIFEVGRIKSRIKDEPSFAESVFTEVEIKYCNQFRNRAERFAARYAAKEALMKALGTGWRHGISFKEIEVVNDSLGKPGVKLRGMALKKANELDVTEIHLSLSHTKDLAIAYVIITNHNT